jgi:hypothetical protein
VPISAPPAGIAPIGKPMAVPRSHGFHDRRQSSRVIQTEPLIGLDGRTAADAAGGDAERFTDGKQRHRKGGHLDTVEQVGDAEGEAGLAGLQVDADQAERQADEQRGETTERRSRRRRQRRS